MAKTLSTAPARSGPPPFWHQLPQVFKYPAHMDALVKIVCFAVAASVVTFFPVGILLSRLVWLAFLAYCFGILEPTARGHLVAAEVFINDRVNKDWRPIKQVVIFIVFILLAVVATMAAGPVAGQVTLFLVSLAIPASIMVLALDERLRSALNPVRLMETIAGIGLPYFALCVFLFLLLESAQFLEVGLAIFLPEWLAPALPDMVAP